MSDTRRVRSYLALPRELGPFFAGASVVACLTLLPRSPFAQEPADTADTGDRQELIERIEELESRLDELESTAVLSEPETRVRRIEVYVDENGVQYDEPVPGAEPVVTYQRERVYRRQLINEKIEDALDEAAARSVGLGVDAAIVFQHATQISGDDTIADGNSYQLASTDLFFTAGLAQYTVFFADIVGLSGTPPDAEIDALNLLNGYTARLVRQNELNLREAWLMTELADQRVSLTAGRLDLTNFFDHNAVANDETSQFVSDALVNNPMLGLSENGAGLTAVYDPKNGFTAKFGYQQSSSAATNLSDSLFYLGEVAKLWTPFGLGEGNYRLWYRKDNGSGTNREALGLSIDQRITPTMILFGRAGFADSETADDDRFYSAGIQFRNGLVFNPDDVWGIGYARTKLGTGDEERLVEGYYNLRMTEKLALSFHLTHVTEDPVATGKISYILPGLRLQASF
jgi:hypothetical protein